MYHQTDDHVPVCPGCQSRHYPATLGDGTEVWCNGRKATSLNVIVPAEIEIPESI